MYLLQTTSRYAGQLFKKSADPVTSLIFVGVILFLFVLLIVGNSISQKKNQSPGSRKYNKRGFRKAAQTLGLSKKQILLLEDFIRTYHVTKPFALLSNTSVLNNTLGKAVRDADHLQGTNRQREARKLEIYRIKQRIERVAGKFGRISSTKDFRLNDKITFELESGLRYNSVVTANLKEFFCGQVPKDKHGDEVRWKKGTRIKVYLWGTGGAEFSFVSKTLGYNSIKGFSSILLSHSQKVTHSHQRKFRRKSLNRPCYFFPIKIIESGYGRKITKEAVVLKNQGHLGTILDVSAGGCSINSNSPLRRGELLKIEFETTRGNSVVAFGKVINMRLTGRRRGIMHIMFTKASGKNLNRINAYVYDFA
ncbi:PilZ domain-containing protein [Spirochaeta isovalerica]|uniref:PilZ domain-containing protein n=1 Tax=Spirochaeta isovalerica TaxID=150 RepID=A0A841R161_9SPIO|nr:PilZ domain-containing protein [Spirochaeta isovalerica]MBB6478694.1 hypothetical protein [Spirochaeta isovalerica]